MTSKTSFCNSTLLKKNLTRFWPLWALFTLGLLLVVRPYVDSFTENVYYHWSSENLVMFHVIFGDLAFMPYGVICAACCFGYLHKARSAYMLHAFPVTRGVLFRTNLISGLLFFLMPWTAVTIWNILGALSAPSLVIPTLLESYGIGILEFLFFYGLAIACMHITGNTVYGVLTYLALNIIAVLLQSLTLVVLQPLLYGITLAENISLTFSPYLKLFLVIVEGGSMSSLWLYIAILGAVGIAFMGIAWLLYRRRSIESCGETIAYPFARPIFQYLLALLGALCLGLLSMGITYGEIYVGNSILPTLLFLLFGGFVGYWVAEMMLRRSVRVFQQRAWIGFCCFAAVLVTALCAVRFDWFNIVGYVPDTDDVSYVEISNSSSPYHNSCNLIIDDDLQRVSVVHQNIVDACHNSVETYRDYTDALDITLQYHFKDGTTLTRVYSLPPEAEEAYWSTIGLMQAPDVTMSTLERLQLSEATSVQVYGYNIINFSDITLSNAQIERLAEYLQKDVEANRFTFFSEETESLRVMLIVTTGNSNKGTDHTCRIYIPASATLTLNYLIGLAR